MMKQGALDGVVVLDFTQFESGTVCTQTLAWLGATVIKLEKPGTGEQGRGASRDRPNEDSYGFLILNNNKKSVTVDVKKREGRDLVLKMVEKADVFIENFSPGVIERLGFDYETLRSINSGIVYAQIKGFGTDGPYAKFPAFDAIGQAAGGVMSITGEHDGPPMHAGANIADSGAGYHCAIAVLGALYQRTVTGEGQKVEVTMQDVMINFSRSAWGRQMVTGKEAPRVGNEMPMAGVAPCNVYPCKPGDANDYVFIYTSRHPGSKQWQNLLKVIGREDLLEDPRFTTPESRYEYKEEVDRLISSWTSQRTKYEAMEVLGNATVPASAVLSTTDISEDLYLRERGMIVEVDHPIRGKLVMPGNSIKLSASNVPIEPAPLLGQHNEKLYKELFEFSEEELSELRAKGVI
ncbi:CaiB/BaiF CoA transferase family protein [Halalkalibacter krulwichiae]|uniref:Formyl-coenzyme A transferase n=1 Tax=Halalkalibacter krulwichiae TaxID=199441 RepID=A0A1X9MB94_9BACI|nr:CoA transferase [Halalkalibacter krulwichiae]ARK29914.1 Formyl-coenzyme A transferase [Halalkalibacter krulwichiae]